MDAVLLMLFTFIGYIIAYRLYGKFIGSKIFSLSPKAVCPSVKFEDGQDYVPTRKGVVFGFHFTAIAGTGPIVGPAIGIIWGWVPAMIWVFFGSILVGAVHDFGALVISLRNDGKSIFDYTSRYLNKRSRILFFVIIFFALWVTLAVFGLVVAIIFSLYPESIIPFWSQILIALCVWFALNKMGCNFIITTVIGVLCMYLSMVIGLYCPVVLPSIAGIPATGLWTAILLLYGFIASVIPVTVLLQSRGYLNGYQLVFSMLLLVIGIIVAGFTGKMEIVAPAIRINPQGAPPIIPFLFVVIACGAVSGLHALISSGVSSKQVQLESDALFVGYGSMLLEGGLATLAIIAVSAGVGISYLHDGLILTGTDAWFTHYSSWSALSGLGSKLHAFTDGSANMIAVLGVSKKMAVVVIGVFVASFAGTTMDSILRIQRYILSEFFVSVNAKGLSNKYFTAALAAISALGLAFSSGASGNGALVLWPLLGAVNQMLACSALIIITLFLRKKGGLKWMVSGIPAIFMVVVVFWASVENQFRFNSDGNMLLQIVNLSCIIVLAWLLMEGIRKFSRT